MKFCDRGRDVDLPYLTTHDLIDQVRYCREIGREFSVTEVTKTTTRRALSHQELDVLSQ